VSNAIIVAGISICDASVASLQLCHAPVQGPIRHCSAVLYSCYSVVPAFSNSRRSSAVHRRCSPPDFNMDYIQSAAGHSQCTQVSSVLFHMASLCHLPPPTPNPAPYLIPCSIHIPAHLFSPFSDNQSASIAHTHTHRRARLTLKNQL